MTFHCRSWFEKISSSILKSLSSRKLVEEALAKENPPAGPLRFVALGKAADEMTRGFLDTDIGFERGIVIRLRNPQKIEENPKIHFFQAEHPIPERYSFVAGKALVSFVDGLSPGGTLMVFISGGGSAMAALPVMGLTKKEKTLAHKLLIGAGLPIQQINVIRRHISKTKGGKLLRSALAKNVTVRVYAISDVSGDFPHDIASGPFSPDPTSFRDALEIAKKVPGIFPSIARILVEGAEGRIPENLRPDEVPEGLYSFRVLANQEVASRVAGNCLSLLGEKWELFPEKLAGNPEAWVEKSLKFFFEKRLPEDYWMISSGEAEVAISPGKKTGKGGRVSTLLLEMASECLRRRIHFEVLGIATDGNDGNSGFSGGFLRRKDIKARDAETIARALKSFNSGSFLQSLGTVFPGKATGTNLGDLILFRGWQPKS